MATKLFMVPCPIAEIEHLSTPQYVTDVIHSIDYFIVERSKTARRYLKAINHPTSMQDMHIEEMDKHDSNYATKVFYEWSKLNVSIGVISEAGCPGIADPGASIAHEAHKRDIPVIPLIGPSSIFLALMASGMNGQKFTFHGYLPHKKELLSGKIRELEKTSNREKSAEIFIETPYRNEGMFDQLINTCSGETYLCIAADINGPTEYVKKKKMSFWKQNGFPLGKKIPAIFILGK